MDQSTLAQKLSGPISQIIERHRPAILPLLGSAGDLSHAALRNDDTVRSVATFTYALLPGLLRLAVKEPAYVDFVMANREKVLGQLVQTAKQ